MNVLSLFSGIGGLDLGLERAGMTIVGQVEIDPWCRQILSKHWPEVPRHDDVRTAAGWWGGRPVDLVCGGFPCQPVSVAGRGLAQADPRWLWPPFYNVIRHLRPRFVFVENVPGLLAPVRVKDADGRFLGYAPAPVEEVLGDLAKLGYDAEWDCLSAAHFDAPHLRERVWMVAYPVSYGLREQPVTERGSGRQALAAVNGAERHVADAERLSGELRAAAPQRSGRPASSGDELADAHSTTRASARPASETVFRPSEVERPRRCGCRDGHTWPAEPDVGRVAHGVPRRVDRLRGLGNAVVPQVAEHIGRLILEAAA